MTEYSLVNKLDTFCLLKNIRMKTERTNFKLKNYLSQGLIVLFTLVSVLVQLEISAKDIPIFNDQKEENLEGSICSSSVDYGKFLNEHSDTKSNNSTPGSARVQCLDISGRVFEDINYGGGDGRDYNTANTSASSSGWLLDAIALNNVRIELYDNTGAFVSATITDASGQYTFLCASVGNYSIRAVNQTITSNRASNSTWQTVIPSQTYRHTGSVAVTNEVGGFDPYLTDAGPNTTGSALSTLYTASTTVQSLSTVALTTTAVVGVDFGFNFDLIVNTNDSGQGSLRQFILNSNELSNANLDQETNPAAGQNFIKPEAVEHSIFMIPGLGVHTIIPVTALPVITDDYTHLTGYTQEGSSQGTIVARSLTIELSGNTVLFDGLRINASNITLSGLVINKFRFGITGTTANNNQFIWGNYIGTSTDGLSGLGNSSAGIRFQNVTSSFIGTNGDITNDANEGNLVSDNYEGINLRSTSGVNVSGNIVGLNSTGNAELGNSFNGIYIRDAAGINVIGFDDNAISTTLSLLRNVSSGNGNDGIRLVSSSNQIIAGNYLGTDVTGTIALGNRNYGIQISGAASDNIIGTDSDGNEDASETNVISGNGSGLRFLVAGTGTNNRISGNFVGVDMTGNTALGNLNNGIEVNNSYSNTIIGTNGDNINDVIERNIISGNDDDGIRLSSTNDNTIAGNYIGLGVDGVTPIPNGKRGIFFTLTSSNNVVGYSPSMANTDELIVGNFIKYNGDSGIGHSGSGTQNRYSRNQLEHNGTLGIDLGYDSVTSNDNGDGDSGANDLLNFPVLTAVIISNNDLTIKGFAPAGSNLEFFLADSISSPNPLPGGYTASFGEGKLYLFEATEGSLLDLNTTIGTYDNDGTGNILTRTQSEFQFTFDVTGVVFKQGMNTSLEEGMYISATATDTNNSTSEFSNITEILPCLDCITLAENDINQTPHDVPVDGNVLTNDTDPTDDAQTVQSVTGINAAGATVTIPVDGTPAPIYDEAGTLAGTISINPDGSYTFVPDAGYTGSVPLEYTVIDANGFTDTASLDIDVIGTPAAYSNNPPVANDDTNSTEQDVNVSGDVITPNDSDLDGDPLTVTAAAADTDGDGIVDPLPIGTPAMVYGTDKEGNPVLAGEITLNSDGTYSFDPDPNFLGKVPIDYTIEDPSGASDDATLTITVEPDLGNTTFGNDDANAGLEGVDQMGNILDNDNDPEGDTQTVTGGTDSAGTTILADGATVNILPNGGTLVLGDDGTYTYEPLAGFLGTEVIIYEVCDNGTPQACETQTLYLTTLPDVFLPIELAEFNVNEVECKNILEWTTLTEINTSHFEIQFSNEGDDFFTVGTVKASGNTAELRYYSFTHDARYNSSYYRLKSVDVDGSSDFSKILSITSNCKNSDYEFSVYPSPVQDELTLSFGIYLGKQMKIQLTDIIGRVVYEKNIQLNDDEIMEHIIDTAQLAAGTYIVNIEIDKQINATKRFIKLEK